MGRRDRCAPNRGGCDVRDGDGLGDLRWHLADLGAVERSRMSLQVVPITIKDACAFITQNHRHHSAPQGALFALAVASDNQIVGVATVGRPVARHADNGWSAEVTRCCTDGTRNACSMLYGAAWRACRALGYQRLITYTLGSESGASLRGSGWVCLGESGGGRWSRKSRPRIDTHPLQVKMKWAIEA